MLHCVDYRYTTFNSYWRLEPFSIVIEWQMLVYKFVFVFVWLISALPGCVDDARSVESVVDLLVAVVVVEVGVIGSPVHITSIKQPFNTIDWHGDAVRDNIGAYALDYGSCITQVRKLEQKSWAIAKITARCQSNMSVHHYECVALCFVNILQ